MKKNISKNWSAIISIGVLGVLIIFSINIATRVSLIEERSELLLTNTMSIVDHIARVLTSLESDKVIEQLVVKMNTLKKDNETLRGQLKIQERELASVSKKEKKCQEQLSKIIGKSIEAERQIKEDVVKAATGNRGYFTKDGKPTE